MLRGMYTGASGMVAQQHRMDLVANNLANVNVTGYKRDVSVHKAFPQLLLRRINDDGVLKFPLGSIDSTPVVGTLGTGVEQNEAFTNFEQGELRETENPFDLAIQGEGFFAIQTGNGVRYTRNGSFLVNNQGFLVTKGGDMVLGEKGPVQLKKNNFVVDRTGVVFHNTAFAGDPFRLVSIEENEWEAAEAVDRLQVVQFPMLPYLEKQGDSYWRSTAEAGSPQNANRSLLQVRQGFLEGSNVDPVMEMVQMIEVQHAYEINQRMIQTQDSLLGGLISRVMTA